MRAQDSSALVCSILQSLATLCNRLQQSAIGCNRRFVRRLKLVRVGLWQPPANTESSPPPVSRQPKFANRHWCAPTRLLQLRTGGELERPMQHAQCCGRKKLSARLHSSASASAAVSAWPAPPPLASIKSNFHTAMKSPTLCGLIYGHSAAAGLLCPLSSPGGKFAPSTAALSL